MASSSMPVHPNPLQQRAAAAAQALLPPGRTVSQREIQAMLEKNETALRGWNSLFKQQPAKTNAAEYKDWIRRCMTFRQQIGARLELLASLADKQIAQEDNSSSLKAATSSSATSRPMGLSHKSTLQDSSSRDLQVSPHPTSAPQQMYMPPQTSTMELTTSISMEPTSSSSTSLAMTTPNLSAPIPPTMFPEPPMPVGFSSTSSNMFFSTESLNPMHTSSGFTPSTSIAASGVTTSTQGFSMSSGVPTFTPNSYIPSTSGPPSSSSGYMNQQNYMIGSGVPVPQQQQFMPMQMPMTMTSLEASETMYGNNNYGVPSAVSMSANGGGLDNNGNNNFMVDPFMTPLEFTSDTSFGSSGFPMTGMTSMSMQEPHQMMGPMNGANFATPMVSNNFGYGANTGMPPAMPTLPFQPPSQPYQEGTPLPQPTTTDSMTMSSDLAFFGDNNVNIFEGLPDDAFFPMQ